MAKKEVIKSSLTPAQYWEWRTTICDINLAKKDLTISELELKIIQKDAEMMVTKAQLFSKVRVEPSRDALLASQKEYDRFVEVLEKDLGQSVKNKIIDEVTFEIKNEP